MSHFGRWDFSRDDDLKTFHKDGTRLSGHPPVHGISEIAFATGSLGHGLGPVGRACIGEKIERRERIEFFV